jgi:glycosyltransferase involved in cell wall biosynthesis
VGRPDPDDPCLAPVKRGLLPGPQRVRVVEILATGTNGGAQEHVYSLISRLDRSRYDVSVISLSPGSAARKIERLGVPVTVLDEHDDAVAVGAVTALLDGIRPDVIHNHMYRAELVGTRAAIALRAIGRRRPHVVSTVHSSRVRSAEDREVLRLLTPEMDRLIAVSRSIVRKLAEEGRVGDAPAWPPVSLIHNGVDLERYDHQDPCCTLREEYGLPDDASIVGIVARLEPEKGHPTLLEAWRLVLREVPSAYLLVVGEGSRYDALAEQAAELGVSDHVVFTGRRDDVPAVTAALDVAVLPSYREAQGLTVLEAMALSRPVVASNVGGIPEMIEDGVTGLLVPPHDPTALAGAIVRLLRDHPYADMLARAGHDLVHRQFCVQLMVHAVEDIYDEGARSVRLREVAAG